MRATLVLLVVVLSGCASLSYGKKRSDNTVGLAVGMAPWQVEETLGKADSASVANGVGVWHYSLLDMTATMERTLPFDVRFVDGKVVAYGQAAQAPTAPLPAFQPSTFAAPKTEASCVSSPNVLGGYNTTCH